MATRQENKNTLFLIPDIESQGGAQEAEGQGYEMAEGGCQAMEELKDNETRHEIIQGGEVEQACDLEVTGREYQATEVLENRRIPQKQTQEEEEEDDDDLLDQEKDNAANSRILDKTTTTIYLRKRVGDSNDVSKLAKH